MTKHEIPKHEGIMNYLCFIQLLAFAITVEAAEPNPQLQENTGTMPVAQAAERQITQAPHGHILTNTNVWSPDSQWIVYDIRSDQAGTAFDGNRIERVQVSSGRVQCLYQSGNGACCGVATYSPTADQVVFILGPEHPTPEWEYAAHHRRGVIVDVNRPGKIIHLDARDLTPPLTPGALRGGSHVHVFSPDGNWVSFTYQDHLLDQFSQPSSEHDIDLRNVGVSVPSCPVRVTQDHPRNHDGEFFSVLVTRTTASPTPGSDQIKKAYEDAWIGRAGYRRQDGNWQDRAMAFQGDVVTSDGQTIAEAFLVDIPTDVTIPSDGPLEGTMTRRPVPPRGTVQRRLTYTADRRYPGLQGPRHWLRSSPDGSRIALLMKDQRGIVQLWTVSPHGDQPLQITHNSWDIASAFSWSPNGKWIAHVMDNSVFITNVNSGRGIRLTARCPQQSAPRPEACVFSPDGTKVAYVRTVPTDDGRWFNQIFIVPVDAASK